MKEEKTVLHQEGKNEEEEEAPHVLNGGTDWLLVIRMLVHQSQSSSPAHHLNWGIVFQSNKKNWFNVSGESANRQRERFNSNPHIHIPSVGIYTFLGFWPVYYMVAYSIRHCAPENPGNNNNNNTIIKISILDPIQQRSSAIQWLFLIGKWESAPDSLSYLFGIINNIIATTSIKSIIILIIRSREWYSFLALGFWFDLAGPDLCKSYRHVLWPNPWISISR